MFITTVYNILNDAGVSIHTKAKREKALEAIAEGLSVKEAAKKAGVSERSVRNYIKAADVQPEKKDAVLKEHGEAGVHENTPRADTDLEITVDESVMPDMGIETLRQGTVSVVFRKPRNLRLPSGESCRPVRNLRIYQYIHGYCSRVRKYKAKQDEKCSGVRTGGLAGCIKAFGLCGRERAVRDVPTS